MVLVQKDNQSTLNECELLQFDKAISNALQYFGFPAKEGKFVELNKKKRN